MTALIFKSNLDLFGIELIRVGNFAELLMRFIFNLIVILLIVRYIYYPRTHRRDFLFTFLLIGIVVFLICFLLESVKLELGFALGLFAVFGIIRYRTMQIPIKEMTYLFIIIGVSVVNALANKKVSYAELLFTNLAIVGITYWVERFKNLENESFTIVLYEKIEKVKPAFKAELIQELEERLGLKINRVEIGNFDYQRDVVKIYVYFFRSRQSWGAHEDFEYRTFTNE